MGNGVWDFTLCKVMCAMLGTAPRHLSKRGVQRDWCSARLDTPRGAFASRQELPGRKHGPQPAYEAVAVSRCDLRCALHHSMVSVMACCVAACLQGSHTRFRRRVAPMCCWAAACCMVAWFGTETVSRAGVQPALAAWLPKHADPRGLWLAPRRVRLVAALRYSDTPVLR